ncbi:MAG: type II toxin-antitoxin system HicA family toxin [Syntrophobacteraceae bacterium]
MSKDPKLYQKALNSPQNLTFEEVCRLAESVGYVLRDRTRSGSSHRVYTHPSVRGIMNFQSYHGKAKPYQVRQLLDKIVEHNLMEEE